MPPPNTSYWGLRLQIRILGGHEHSIHPATQMSLDEGMFGKTLAYPCNRIRFIIEKKWVIDKYNNLDGIKEHYV